MLALPNWSRQEQPAPGVAVTAAELHAQHMHRRLECCDYLQHHLLLLLTDKQQCFLWGQPACACLFCSFTFF